MKSFEVTGWFWAVREHGTSHGRSQFSSDLTGTHDASRLFNPLLPFELLKALLLLQFELLCG